ncbi:MAG: 1-(5-phosphoribosyl)-5-[(5-phosphoribosylamino)methylideneamino]imidazole-4-carboxamide isomerase [Actinomycetota bacterium]
MPFEVIPALDVAGGRLVRMSAGGAVPVAAFGGDPLAAASAFVEAGATRLHVVDVDLASSGRPSNLDVLRVVCGFGVPVQASGGVATASQADALLGAGAERVVLGSAALADRGAAAALIAALGERACVGVEAAGSAIRPRGGGDEMPLWETLEWLAGLDVARYLFTEVGRVGALSGPDLDGIWALAMHTRRPVIASGGIRSVEDLRAIAGLGGTVEGAVVGRALQEGLELRDALSVAG